MKKILIAIVIIIIICIGIGGFLFLNNKSSEEKVQSTSSVSQLSKESSNGKENENSTGKEISVVPTQATNSLQNSPSAIGTKTVSNKENETNKNIESSKNIEYASESELANISGNYTLDNFTIGENSKLANEISSITINSNGVVLNNDYNGNNPYSSSEKMRIWKMDSRNFQLTFGVSPESQGLNGNEFNVYSIGYVFIYQLPNKNILFSFENVAGTTIDNSNNIAPSNISNWYGTYTVGNIVGQLNGYNADGVKANNITGQKVVITANEYKYGNVIIQNPKYYLFKVSPQALSGTSFSGAALINGSVYCIAVLSPKYPMDNFLYRALPSYVGCTSGAWAANVAMPIILGANNSVQVLNDINQICSTTKDN